MCPVPFYLDSSFAREAAGLEVGTAFTKSVIVFDKSILGWAVMPSGGNYRVAADDALKRALAMADISLDSLAYIIATGPKAETYPSASQFSIISEKV